MDEFERRRKHRDCSSSVDSLLSSSHASSPVKESEKQRRDARTSTGNGRSSLDDAAVREAHEDKKGSRFVGRLRALTGGRERERERDREEKMRPYPGT